MKLNEIIERAKEIRNKYASLEIKKYGKEWTNEEILQGFVHDVEELKDLMSTHASTMNSLTAYGVSSY